MSRSGLPGAGPTPPHQEGLLAGGFCEGHSLCTGSPGEQQALLVLAHACVSQVTAQPGRHPMQKAQWHRDAHLQFIQAVLGLLQPVAVEKVIVHLMVLDSGIGSHSPRRYFPHGHAESPLRTKPREVRTKSLSTEAEWTVSWGKVISLKP